ncbi:hypothetical protein ACFFGV_17740 [Pontibacillus salicampi]|uniref:Uncharacterized protein n=1 Tax=Pontibacillus salicampi TaxID=1449801 RepID=A0ABV6LSN9_9BACI
MECESCRMMLQKLRKQEELLTQLIHFVANNHERIVGLESEVKQQPYKHLIS